MKPRCSVPKCRGEVTRWDGGEESWRSSGVAFEPAPPVWLCDKHDPNHKWFDIPAGAVEDIYHLRMVIDGLRAQLRTLRLERER